MKIYAKQTRKNVYTLVNESGFTCDYDGGLTVWPIEIWGDVEEQIEYPVWRNGNENHKVQNHNVDMR